MAEPAPWRCPLAARASPPVPAGTVLAADPSLEWVADTLVAGGSPWRLLRLTRQGAGLLASWLEGEPVSVDPAERRARAPARRRRAPAPRLGHRDGCDRMRSPSSSPSATTPRGSTRLLRVTSRTPAVRVTVVDDGSSDAASVAAIAAAHDAALVRHDVPLGPAAARNAGCEDRRRAAARVPRRRHHAVRRLAGRAGPLLRRPDCRRRRAARAGPVGRLGARIDSSTRPRRSTSARSQGVVRPGAAVPFVPAAALVVRRARSARASTRRSAPARTWTSCGGWWPPGWQVRYEPGVVVTHAARPTWRAWVAQRFAYGLSAAPLEARHGDAAAPLRADPRVLATLGARARRTAARRRSASSGWSALVARAPARRHRRSSRQRVGGAASSQRAGTALAAPGLARSAFRTYGPLLVVGGDRAPAAAPAGRHADRRGDRGALVACGPPVRLASPSRRSASPMTSPTGPGS